MSAGIEGDATVGARSGVAEVVGRLGVRVFVDSQGNYQTDCPDKEDDRVGKEGG